MMRIKTHYQQYDPVMQLENTLGSPEDKDNLFSWERMALLDEQSLFPQQQAEYLTRCGVHQYYVPVALGGKLASFETCVSIFRAIYRRDITLGLGHGSTTLMAVVSIFLAGNDVLKKRVAELILAGNTLSVAYHEADHGNDVLSNETSAVWIEKHYRMDGKKWLINNASTSKGITVFAKTSEQSGGRGYSLFFIDKASVDATTLSYMPKIKTLGVRGCQLAGVMLNQTQVPESAVIGKIGDGLELTFKAFQITRAILPGMSIGAGDTALRCVMKFVMQRSLYGHPMMNIPHVNETLSDAFIQLLLCDALSMTVTRSLHCIPEQMSIIAAITKLYIPKMIQKTLKDLSVILGARHYLREGEYAIFQKILRDYPVVSIGHSSNVICAQTILAQLTLLLSQSIRSEKVNVLLKNIFLLSQPLPAFEAKKLHISNHGYNDIMQSLDCIETYMAHYVPVETIHDSVNNAIQKALAHIHLKINTLKKHVTEINTNIFTQKTYDCVEVYSEIFVALSCILLWIFNYSDISDFFDSGAWLALSLNMILSDAYLLKSEEYRYLTQKTWVYLSYLFTHKLSFSMIPIGEQS